MLKNFFCTDNAVQRNVSESNLNVKRRISLKRPHEQLTFSRSDDIEEILNNKISTQNLLSHYLAPPKPDTPIEHVSPICKS